MENVTRLNSLWSFSTEMSFINFLLNPGGCVTIPPCIGLENELNAIKPFKKIKLEENDENVTVKKEPIRHTDCLSTFPRPMTVSKPQPRLKVQFLNLKQVYEKVQSRVNKQSKQRLSEARVRMVVSFDAQISEIKVYVERAPEAAALCRDKTGRVRLQCKMGQLSLNKQYLSVDLDSVYLSDEGTPVYKLSTVDSDRRNRFRIVVVIVFIDGCQSKSYVSRPFLLRSQKRSAASRRFST